MWSALLLLQPAPAVGRLESFENSPRKSGPTDIVSFQLSLQPWLLSGEPLPVRRNQQPLLM